MKWALVDSNNIVQNTIDYDGQAEYTPPDGLSLQQVNDWLNIGSGIDDSIPPPPLAASPIPDLATQLAAALINANVIPSSAINTATLATVNATLTAAGESQIN